MAKAHRATVGGCTNTGLIAEARKAGKCFRDAIARGDCSLEVAFNNSGVGYPYMTAADASAAFEAFRLAARAQ